MLNGSSVRGRAGSWLRALSARKRVNRDERLLDRSAVVFAPHPDDETLGCGGTILKKTRAGADVTIVVMTDGGASHRDFMDPDRLREVRAAEAVEAARRLGVAAKGVHLLGFADKGLREAAPEAKAKVFDILQAVRPGEIYVPYEHDTPADHRVTRAVVLEASNALDEVVVYEYPVWFWFHWPWVAFPQNNRRDFPRIARDTTRSMARLLHHLSSAVYIGDVLDQKRNALDAYSSQMTRLVNDPRWARLEDVAGGEFLALFFEPYELFREYKGGTV